MSASLLERLRATPERADNALSGQFGQSGVRFVASDPRMEARHTQAVRELLTCIKPTGTEKPILNEGGVYFGCWLESTGTINTELLSRFMPEVAQATFEAFADNQRDDGLFPYKITDTGPVFSQIQLVSPLARSIWTHYRLNGQNRAFLEKMYSAMARYDGWIAQHRDTRGTGAVEAFCAFDTGHDLSARFWHIPDSPHQNDPAQYRRDNPLLPYIAPDLTANIACQRHYLAEMADELGLTEQASRWRDRAADSEAALFAQCYDQADGFFYDRDGLGRLVRLQSDVLLRVLACEIGDDTFFDAALAGHLLNTRKFFAKYPFTSIAMDDPRFDPAFDYNSWCGPTNFLSLIRTPHAFEHHGRHVELTWVLYPILAALFRADRFPQTLNPFTGRAGFTEAYSPSILCLLDFVERLCGIAPRPDGTLWFTGLVPYQVDHRDVGHETGYARTVDGTVFELVNTPEAITAWCNGEALFTAPKGVRVITDRQGEVQALIGMSVVPVRGRLTCGSETMEFEIAANERLEIKGGTLACTHRRELVHPVF